MQFNQRVLTSHWRVTNEYSALDQRVQRVTDGCVTTMERQTSVLLACSNGYKTLVKSSVESPALLDLLRYGHFELKSERLITTK